MQSGFSPDLGNGLSDRKSPLPVMSLALMATLVAAWCVFTTNLGAEAQHAPLLLAGALLAFISVFDIRIGLAVLLLAIGLSPEFQVYGIDNFRYEDVVFPIVFMIWVSGVVLHKGTLLRTDLRAPILVIVFMSLISSLSNHIYFDLELKSATLRFGKSVMYYFMMVVVLNTMKSKRDLKAFMALMIVASAFVGLYGVTQIATDNSVVGGRLMGPPGETANILGGYFVFHICLALGMLTRARSNGKAMLILYLALMAMPFIMTLSRTSYVALAVGGLIIWVLGRNHTLGWAVVLIAASALLAPDYVIDRTMTIFDAIRGGSVSSWDARVDGWTHWFIPQALQSPLLGQGVGSSDLGAVDSEYVLQLNDLGIVGLIAFLVLMYRCVRTSRRLYNADEDPTLSGFALGYFGGAIALLVHSLAATTFTTIRTTEPFFFATGLLYAYWNMSAIKKSRSNQHQGHDVSSEHAVLDHARKLYDPVERKKRLEKRFPNFQGRPDPS